jgi:hypothetical protein
MSYATHDGDTVDTAIIHHWRGNETPVVINPTIDRRGTPVWDVTANFHKTIAEGGKLPPHNFYRYWDKFNSNLVEKVQFSGSSNPNYYILNANCQVATGSHILSGAPGSTLSLGLYDSQESLAEARAIRKFYDAASRGDFQALVTAAEAPKAFALIGDTARRLARTFKSLKRGDVIGAAQAIGLGSGSRHVRNLNRLSNTARKRGALEEFASNSWLELQYGWKPLLQDCRNGAEALSLMWEVEPSDIVIRVGDSKSSDPRYVGGNGVDSIDASGESKSTVGIVVYLRIIDQSTRNFAGLGLYDPLSVAWELLPYSFVVDWFIPVGSWIAAQSALAGTEFDRGSLSKLTKVKANATVEYRSSSPNPGTFSINIDSTRFWREVLDDVPSISKILYVSNFAEAMGFQRATSGIALLSNAFRR